MAFNFLGTIGSIEQFEEFEEFILIEATRITKRIDHIQKERLRFGETLDKFSKADAELRSEYSLSDMSDADYLANPRPVPVPKVNTLDGLNAIDVDDLKKMTLDTIKFKRERNEFKIKRLRDIMEQCANEASFLEEKKEEYEDILNKIKTRFDLPDFIENQRVGELDSADLTVGVRATQKGQGRETVNGTVYYLVLGFDPGLKTITFDTVPPPVEKGDKIILSNGNNNGEKTVTRVVNGRTIQVFEELVEEYPAKSKASKV